MNHYQSGKYHLRIAYETRVGGRPENQDALALSDTPLGFLAVVCDGMGGGPGGATASTLAAKTIVSTLTGCTPLMPRRQALKLAVDRAQTVLENAMRSNPTLQGMGSTLVALLLNKESVLIAHLGDSRCYRLSQGRIAFRTADHSLVGELVQYGSMTEEQARRSPTANVITRGLGATSNHVAQIDEVPYRRGDRFVLCTDGIWGSMPQPQLLTHIMPPKAASDVAIDLPQAVDRLGQQNGNHHDNHTLIVIDTDTQSILKDKMGKREIILCAAFAVLLVISMVVNGILLSKLAAHRQQAEAMKQKQEEVLAQVHRAAQGEGVDIASDISPIVVGLIVEAEHKALAAQAMADTLAAQVQQLRDSIAAWHQLESEAASSTGTSEKNAAPPSSVQEQIDAVLALLDTMRTSKSYRGTPEDFKAQQAARAKRASEHLGNINDATNGKHRAKIGKLQSELKPNQMACVVSNFRDQRGGYYAATAQAKESINLIYKDVEALGKKLSPVP